MSGITEYLTISSATPAIYPMGCWSGDVEIGGGGIGYLFATGTSEMLMAMNSAYQKPTRFIMDGTVVCRRIVTNEVIGTTSPIEPIEQQVTILDGWAMCLLLAVIVAKRAMVWVGEKYALGCRVSRYRQERSRS